MKILLEPDVVIASTRRGYQSHAKQEKPWTLKGIVNLKIKILSLITHPHVVPNPEELRSSSDKKLRYFWWNPKAFWACIDSNGTTMFKVQKGSKDIFKIVHVTLHSIAVCMCAASFVFF